MDERICLTCGFTFDATREACTACGAPVGATGADRGRRRGRIGAGASDAPGRAARGRVAAPKVLVGAGDPRLLLLAWVSIVMAFAGAFLPWISSMGVEVAGIAGAGKRTAGFAVLTALVFAAASWRADERPGRRWWVVISFAMMGYTFINYVNWLAYVATWEPTPEQPFDIEVSPGSGLYLGAIFGIIGTWAIAFWGRGLVFERSEDATPPLR